MLTSKPAARFGSRPMMMNSEVPTQKAETAKAKSDMRISIPSRLAFCQKPHSYISPQAIGNGLLCANEPVSFGFSMNNEKVAAQVSVAKKKGRTHIRNAALYIETLGRAPAC